MFVSKARIFNETPINPRRCLHILTKIIYLLNQVCDYILLFLAVLALLQLSFSMDWFISTLLIFQGEHFGTTEATEAFFAMTRLFQSNDVRHFIYWL